ncbi:branched-chain amino acid ABC transporter permease [Saccharopolyspora sp. K220]|uniref:branched-chain amino acid ABC transporter permease n=1 Tax=Saccharopolyspora soli TaxID=2926618 RepID=UPI001F57259C|nr:branched-chain amino acid ABC transporter permease [Saccharopolyspora soli]MCI2419991.1 branched-chain amino acid ABC transporter permease [Saccharopolyspora soli]
MANSKRRLVVPAHLRWPVGAVVVAVLVFLAYYYLIPNLPSGAQGFFRTWLPLTSVNEALVWVICALGLNIVVGYAGLLDLGFVAFWALGGYTAGWLMSGFFHQVNVHFLDGTPAALPGIHLSFWPVLIIGGAFCALWGVIIGAPTLRLKGDYLALVTLGFGEIIPQVFTNGENIFGFNLSNGTKGIAPVDPINIGPVRLGPFDLVWKYVIFALIAALVIFMSLRLRDGRLGRAWLAIREDELAANMMGVPIMRTKLAAYAVGAVAGGLAGVAFATHLSAVLPDRFNFSISITLLAMVVLGGMGNVWGVTLSALLLAWVNSTGLPQFGNAFNAQFGTDINFPSYNFLLFGGILVLMMLYRREGILPESRTRLILREPSRTDLESQGADLEQAAPELDEVLGERRLDRAGEGR